MAQTIPYAVNSFAAGEWDPQLLASTDLAKYKTANRVMRNFFSHVNGKASNRPGTVMCCQTATSTTNQSAVQNTRVIPFIFNTSQSYVVEFSNNIIRFIKNGSLIMSGGNPYSITSPYTSAQVMQLGYTQSADTIFLAHPNVAPQMLQRISDTSWTLTPYPFQFGPWLLDNTNTAQLINATAFGSNVTTSVTSIILVSGGGGYSGGEILTVVQAGGSGCTFQVGPSTDGGAIDPAGFTLLTGGSGYTNGMNLATTASGGGAGATVTIAVGSNGQIIPNNIAVTLTATGCTPFNSGHVGALWEVYHYVPNQTVNNAAVLPTPSISCGGTWRFITNGTWTGDVWVEKSLDGGNTWLQLNYYNGISNFNINTYGTEDMSNNAPPFLVRANGAVNSGTIEVTLTADPYIQPGIISITSFQSSTVVYGVVTQPIGLNNTATSDWAEGAWSTYRGWPSTCEFSPDDRLCWSNTPYQPISTFATTTGNYYNFNVSDPLVDSDAIQVNLPSRQLNAINSLIPLRAVLALTSGGEWSIESTQGVTAPLTPSTVYQRVHGYEGSTQVRPVCIGIRAIFVQALGKVIRDVGYELIFDSFVGANISLFSNHLFFFDNIVDMCYCQNPDSLVWLVMKSGKLVSLTYLREQQVVSFSPHDTFGAFMSCCSIADTVNNYNVPYFVVNRANGQFIEYMPKRMLTTNIQDQFFVDCGGVYDALGQTFQNADFEQWSFGPNFAPDYWTLVQSGTVSQCSAPATTQSVVTNVENGNSSVLLQGTNPILHQRMDQAYGSTYWQGRTVTFNAFVRCGQANTACVSIFDGVTHSQSAFHPGDNSWQLLSVTATINPSATSVYAQCKVFNGQAYFDNSYFNSGVSQVSGANWLNGQTVSILADGFVLPATTVQNGVISWDGTNYNKVIYGLPYVSQLQPTTPYVPNPAGTMQAHTINIGKAVIGFWNTASGYVGTDFNKMLPIPDLAINNYNPPSLPLYTGNAGVQLGQNAQPENSICIQQSDPLPMTVTFIVEELQISGLPANQGP